jgi:indolepyruvate ferredoxin oxidoreductase
MANRLFQEDGRNVYTGCELLVKGALEGRTNLLTGYPGSPIAEVFDIIERQGKQLQAHGVLAQLANNEALSAARLNGAQMASLRAIAFMKSVGVHVAADALAISNLAGAVGGAVVVMGEDPHSDSTQVPSDSRYIAQHLFLPTLEPSTFQEVKDWVGLALDLSAETKFYIAYIITTHQADGGGVVSLAAHPALDVTPDNPITIDPDKISREDRIMLPPQTARVELELINDRFPLLLRRVRDLGVNRIVHPKPGAQIGFVATGAAYLYLEHALHELGLQGQIPILKLGMSYPIDSEILFEFADTVDHLIVAEERRSFMEGRIKELLSDAVRDGVVEDAPPVWGKRFPFDLDGFPATLGLNPTLVISTIIPLMERVNDIRVSPDRLAREKAFVTAPTPPPATFDSMQLAMLPARTPGFCPGCPHRDSGSILERMYLDLADPEYMKKNYGTGPTKVVFHGDIGCYSMFTFEPFDHLMVNLSGMGLGGGGTGAGVDKFITNKQVVFMGDSTFFHSGVIGISDSIKHGQDITYILLDNKTTGMTGHQTTPGLEHDLMGNPTRVQDIEETLRGLAASADCLIVRADPADHEPFRKLLESTILHDGVKIIIADKECGITHHRRKRREMAQVVAEKGYIASETHVNVTPEVCEFCLECTRFTGCPALKIVDTDYGPKIETDRSTCVADLACAKALVCPSFEQVTVERNARPQVSDFPVHPQSEPRIPDFDGVYNIYSAGVGGMGIGVISAVLTQAGHREGYDVRFCDKKGLAIRNGGVYGHLILSKDPEIVLSTLIPAGKADVVLGMDALEAARAMDATGKVRIANRERTQVVLNTAKTDTIPMLIGRAEYDADDIHHRVRERTADGGYFAADFHTISEKYLGNKIYGNLMLLGAAYQRGLLPFSLTTLLWAIENSVPPRDITKNLDAFRIGRVMAEQPERFEADADQTAEEAIADKSGILRAQYGAKGDKLARSYEELARQAVDRMSDLPADEGRHLAIRVYDLIQYEDVAFARRYVDLVSSVYAADDATHGYAATCAALRYLHKVMCIKDEVYVAHLLTSEEKRRRDYARYGVEPANGDSIKYVHLNRPVFTLFGRDVEFRIRTRDWHLKLMKRMKFLRAMLPAWHRQERDFRDWYIGIVERFSYTDEASYMRMVEALECPDEVRGYRDIRYPKMDGARLRVQKLLDARGVGQPQESVDDDDV